MGEGPGQLTEAERRAFDVLVKELRARDARERRGTWGWLTDAHHGWPFARRAAMLFVGVVGLVAGLLADAPLLGVAGFGLVVLMVHRLTRRCTLVRAVLRWRRPAGSPPD